MPRPKRYDRSDAVKKACDAFWQHGYGALGVRSLENLTGLNRFAIQTEFGGKEGLFLETLDRYALESETHLLGPLREGSLDQVMVFFNQIGTPSQEPAQIYGCLMANTVVENAGPASATIKERTDRHFQLLKQAFRAALTHAKSDGQLAGDFDTEEAAAFLVGSTLGIQMTIRKAGSLKTARPYLNVLIKTIESWQTTPVTSADRT